MVYSLIVIVMAVITIIGKFLGIDYVATHCYGAWWFTLLWASLVIVGIFYFMFQRVHRWWVVMLHTSFVLILFGALLTHLTAWKGVVHLRTGEQKNNYSTLVDGQPRERILPFTLILNHFEVKYHPGTKAPADYESQLSVIDGDNKKDFTVSMNHIYSYRSIRIYQMSYDSDEQGSVLSLNSDPYGIPVTYTGYALLFFSLIYMLFDPQGTFRRLLRMLSLLLMLVVPVFMQADVCHNSSLPVLPQPTAAKFGELNILYNNRICPMQTYALDFTKKLYGKTHYGEYTAEQVLTGFLFWGERWSSEPIIKVKGDDLKSALGLPDYASVNTFIDSSTGKYRLAPYVEQYYRGDNDAFHQQVARVDEKVSLVMRLRRGEPLKFFPWTHNGKTEWLALTDSISPLMPSGYKKYLANMFSLLRREALAGNYDRVEVVIGKMQRYQSEHAAATLPSAGTVLAERIYNKVGFATILFIVNLILGFVTFLIYLYQLRRNRQYPTLHRLFSIAFVLSWAVLTFALALRWMICGRIPMSNGYESMLMLAWFVMLIMMFFMSRLSPRSFRMIHLLLSFGFLLSGFFLLVSHINQMDPQITHLMPVLNSPLLSIHVGVIMMSYALFSLTFICALAALVLREEAEKLAVLSRIFLYPGLTTLGLGIFIGAIWANVSWGTYWSWDPKETWALITFMTYGVVVHTQSLPVFQRPMVYHLYMLFSFLTLLMTYFGVNYVLGGMHSYA